MHNRINKKIISGLIFIIAAAIGVAAAFIFSGGRGAKQSNVATPSGGTEALFECDSGKSIDAIFYPKPDDHVDLKLNDGRKLAVPRAISASGARYANSDESFVFWNKGDTAFIQENSVETFQNCVILKTYVNNDYGFELKYPSDYEATSTFGQYYHLQNLWRAEASPASNGKPIVSIPVFQIDQGGVATGKSYPLYFDAELRIGASSDPQDILNCYKPDPGYTSQKITDTTINGIVFKKFDFQNAGMMQYVQGESYRVIHNGMCFAVEQIKTGSSYRDSSMFQGIPDDQLNGYYDEAGKIIQTFKFTK